MTHATSARTLDDIAAESHVFSIIAMDQRNTLRRMFSAVGLDASDDDLRVAKADVARVLTPAASGLLSDPTQVSAFRESVEVAVGIAERLGTKAFNALYGNRIDGTDPKALPGADRR